MTMKTCFKCKRELPRTEFYSHPRMNDGLLGKCKDCTRHDSAEHRLRNIDRVRAYDHQRSTLAHRIALRRRVQLADLEAHPDRHRARAKLQRTVRAGRLVRPPECQRCGLAPHRIEAHHADYTKPLDVEWLCKPCHAKADQERRAF